MSGRRGKRAATNGQPRPRRPVIGYTLGVLLAVVAWGYLVWAAIDFGADARAGDGRAWAFLGIAAVGAMACLFVGLMLVARLARTMGMVPGDPAPAAPRTPGGKRAAR